MILIETLKAASSRDEKLSILKRASTLEVMVLRYTYNPRLKYGITNLVPHFRIGQPSHELFNLLDKLEGRELTGSAARTAVIDFAEANGELIYLILRKDLGCGINITTINKAFPDLIPTFKVQLAKEAPNGAEMLTYPLEAQIKYDGVRVIAIKQHGKVELFTRNGKLINCPELSGYMNKTMSDNCMLDGEIAVISGLMEGRTKVSGRINSALKGGMLSMYGLCYFIFDGMDIERFDARSNLMPYEERFEILNQCLLYDSMCQRVESKTVYTFHDVHNYYTEVVASGYEGLILKSKEHLYTFKRSLDWIKIKAIHSADLICVGVVPGAQGTKYENVIGSLVCTGMAGGEKVSTKVGSGLTDADRNLPASDYLEKTIEVKYNDVIPGHLLGHTLFLPRFVCIRGDL